MQEKGIALWCNGGPTWRLGSMLQVEASGTSALPAASRVDLKTNQCPLGEIDLSQMV